LLLSLSFYFVIARRPIPRDENVRALRLALVVEKSLSCFFSFTLRSGFCAGYVQIYFFALPVSLIPLRARGPLPCFEPLKLSA